MQTIKTVAGQTLYDLAITAYGNVDAAFLLLADPALAGYDLELADALPVGLVLQVDDKSPLYNRAALRALDGATVATL